MATVAMPADVTWLFFGAGVVLLTTVTMMKQQAMRRAEIQNVGLRPHRSEKPKMNVAHMMNFSAPKRPVMSRFRLPPPTSSLKN